MAASRLIAMKRFLAIPLWFYTGWTAGAFVDFVAGMFGLTIGPVLGPVLGTAAAALFVGDPRGLIWSNRPGVSRGSLPRAQLPA
jgi:hypothetical protein